MISPETLIMIWENDTKIIDTDERHELWTMKEDKPDRLLLSCPLGRRYLLERIVRDVHPKNTNGQDNLGKAHKDGPAQTDKDNPGQIRTQLTISEELINEIESRISSLELGMVTMHIRLVVFRGLISAIEDRINSLESATDENISHLLSRIQSLEKSHNSPPDSTSPETGRDQPQGT